MALRARLTATAGLCLALALSSAGVASDIDAGMESALARTEPEPAADGAIVQYPAGFFTQFSPVTARDMIARLPGFTLSEGNNERRGLADAFGNLLVDGRRPSNKSLGLESVLERIPASDVQRIEIIREALPDYDMRGHAQLANVILREGAGRSVNWNAQATHFSSGRIMPSGEIFYSDRFGELEMTTGLSVEIDAPRIERDERVLDPQRNLVSRNHEEDQRRYWEVEGNLSLASPLGESGRIRFDGEVEHWNWRRQVFNVIEVPTATGFAPGGFERLETTNFGNALSGNLSYTRTISATTEAETTLYAQHHDFEDGPERFQEFAASGAPADTVILLFGGEVGERALRQSLSWTPNETHAFDFSIEGAFNYRDTLLELFLDDGIAIAPIPLPVSDARVEELRGEVSANHVWAIRPQYSLESGLRYEVSEIAQSGDVTQERSFTYLKPSVTLVWTPDERTRWRIAGLRDVDQLQFNKFASAVNLTDDASVIGNPDYRPQNTWTLEAQWERRFGEEASVSLTVGRDWIKDLDDFIAVVTPNGVFDAPGNIGDGDRRRVTLEWSSPLGVLCIGTGSTACAAGRAARQAASGRARCIMTVHPVEARGLSTPHSRARTPGVQTATAFRGPADRSSCPGIRHASRSCSRPRSHASRRRRCARGGTGCRTRNRHRAAWSARQSVSSPRRRRDRPRERPRGAARGRGTRPRRRARNSPIPRPSPLPGRSGGSRSAAPIRGCRKRRAPRR